MKIFLGFSFREADQDLVRWCERMFASQFAHTMTGERLGGEALTPAVQSRIDQCDAVIGLLTLLKTDGGIGSALIFGFASFLFVFVQHVIAVFEQPFRPGTHAMDKVSLFLLHEFVAKLRAEPVPAPAQRQGASAAPAQPRPVAV